MDKDIFYYTGELIYRLRWFILVMSLIVLGLCIPILPKVIDPFSVTGFFNANSESAKANKILNKQLGYSYNRFIVVYSSSRLLTTNPAFMTAIKKSLSGLDNLSIPHVILYPDKDQQVSKDKHTAYAVVMFKSKEEGRHSYLKKFKSSIKQPPNLSMEIGGEPIFVDNVSKQTQKDLNKAEYIGTPAAIITLLIIFGSLVAALLPLFMGAYCALVMLTVLYFFREQFFAFHIYN